MVMDAAAPHALLSRTVLCAVVAGSRIAVRVSRLVQGWHLALPHRVVAISVETRSTVRVSRVVGGGIPLARTVMCVPPRVTRILGQASAA